MVKCFALLTKKTGTSDEHFHNHWRTTHAQLALRITSLRRYVQSHYIPHVSASFAVAPFHGAAEVWYDDLATAVGMRTNPQYVEGAYADEPNFINQSDLKWLATKEHAVVAGSPIAKDAQLVKGVFLVKRKPGLSVAEFQDYWRNKHAPLVPRTPHLLKYVQCHVLPETYESEFPPPFDGVAELWWPDLAKFKESWASKEIQVEQLTDAKNFVGAETCAFLAQENRVIWP
ncbi:MAG: EthD family reductase [Deltaproteobacteria bacterium]|nr:EthD family reductase [Deltaproteobacteria bacterium]